MVDQPINALAASVTAAPHGKPTNPWAGKGKPLRLPDGSGAFVATIGTTRPKPKEAASPSRSPQFQTPSKLTNAGGVPRQVGAGERQLDGTRSPEFSQPQRKPGLSERQPAPSASSGGSGLESAMADLADQLHPRRMKPR